MGDTNPDSEKELQRVYDIALRLLVRRAHGEQELRNKLQKRQLSDAAINRALHRCKELNYIDDARFAQDRLRSRLLHSGWGPKRAESELYSLGIGREQVTAALQVVLDEVDLIELATQALAKRFAVNKTTATPKERRRYWDFLFRRGFGAETVRSVVLENY